MKLLGRKATIAIGVVACLAVLAGGWFLLIQPTRSSISKTKSQTALQLQNNQSSQLQLATMRSIAKNLPVEKAELAALQQKVPDQVQLSAILRSMQSLAASSGVKLNSISPSEPTPIATAPGIATVNIALNVTGGYAEIEQFDSALEGLQRTFLVSSFSLTGGGTSSSTSAGTGSSTTASSGPTAATMITASLSGSVLVKSTAVAGTSASSTTATSGH